MQSFRCNSFYKSVLLCLLFHFACASRQVRSVNEHRISFLELQEEIHFGYYVDAMVANYYPTCNDQDLTRKVSRIGKKLVAASDRQDLDFTFKILNTCEVNAFAGPGGFVYITAGMLDLLESKDELAAVLAHEIGHICERHAVRSYDNAKKTQTILSLFDMAASAAGVPAMAKIGGELIGNFSKTITNLTAVIIADGYDNDWEFTADEDGLRYVTKAGYDPHAFLTVLKRLRDIKEKSGDELVLTILSSHPSIEDRISHIQSLLNQENDNETGSVPN